MWAVFAHLSEQRVVLEGLILKPNMVLTGSTCSEQPPVDEVADVSFARMLQEPALEIWRGQKANVAAAQEALFHRATCDRAASPGQYTDALEQESA